MHSYPRIYIYVCSCSSKRPWSFGVCKLPPLFLLIHAYLCVCSFVDSSIIPLFYNYSHFYVCFVVVVIFVVLSPFPTSSYHLFTSCQAAVALSFVGCRFYYDRSFVCLSTFVFACVCLLVCLAFSLLKYLQIS